MEYLIHFSMIRLLLLIAFLRCCLSSEIPVMAKYYCVVGAGPAGLQMAYFLERAGRDYVVFEQSDGPGSFFQRHPRHRRLISTNNRTTGSTNAEFNLRYDLNSLISDDYTLRFAEYSEEYFPTADELITYLRDYQKKLKLGVQFNKRISSIKYHSDAKTDQCRYTMRDQEDNNYCCRNVFIGTGWQKEKVPDHFRGLDHVHTYETMSTDPADFKDKTVLIIGRGFSGIETALSLDGSARSVHVASANPIHLNWEARYLGKHRGLKSRLGDEFGGFFELDIDKIRLKKRKNGKIQVIPVSVDEEAEEEQIPQQILLEGYDHVILCLGFAWSDAIFHESMKVHSFDKPGLPKHTYPEIGPDYQSIQYPGLYFIGPLVHGLDYRKSAGGFLHGFRHIEKALHRLLEWRNHGLKWPGVTKSIDQLIPTMLKRADESAALFHMFSHLCDLAIYDRSTKKFNYLEEFPIDLIPHILRHSGYEFNPAKHSLFVLLFQYGADFSQSPNNADQLVGSKTRDHLMEVDLSNFEHPAVYFYDRRLPSIEDLEKRQELEAALPKADAVHHILQELTTRFDGPTAHISLLRQFIERIVGEDLRSFNSNSCAAYSLTRKRDSAVPIDSVCRNYNLKYDSALLFQ